MTDDITAAIDRLIAMVDSHERTLRPVGQNGLPLADHADDNKRCRYMPGRTRTRSRSGPTPSGRRHEH